MAAQTGAIFKGKSDMTFEEYKKTTRLNDEASWVVSIAESAFNAGRNAGRKAELKEAAEICKGQGAKWDSDNVVAEKNYAAHCGQLILKRAGEIG